ADDREPLLVDVHETSSAGARAAAFGDDTGHVVSERRFHHGRSQLGVDGMHCAVVFNESDLGHGVLVGAAVGEILNVAHATPSFFCRLVEEVVYWNTSFLSG